MRNKGAPGIDGITVKQLPSILKARWPEIEEQLLQGRYQPQPVRRVRIPKWPIVQLDEKTADRIVESDKREEPLVP